MKIHCIAVLFLLQSIPAGAQAPAGSPWREDFDFFWNTINEEYAYFGNKQTDWARVKTVYGPMADTVSSRAAFTGIIEQALYELYDAHCNLNTNTPQSSRLVPTGTDCWAEYINGKPIITEVRMHSGAATCGIKAGMEVLAINGIPVDEAVRKALPRSLRATDIAALSFTLRRLLAGNHVTLRRFTLRDRNRTAEFYPDQNGMWLETSHYTGKISTHMYNDIGYLRINNCLYDNDLVAVFDSAMQAMQHTKGLIIDLRETPSGGNTLVARAILSWFTKKEVFYQKHEYTAEEQQSGIKKCWEEMVSPRPGKYYDRPVVILVNHWTGSIAEAITIAFDSFKRPHTFIVGTTMARLNGAVYSARMPKSGIGFSYTAERLYHINGSPREQYRPTYTIDLFHPAEQKVEDMFMTTALRLLQKK